MLSVAYYYLSTRSGGTDPGSLFNFSKFSSSGFLIQNYGASYFAALVALDVAIAAMSGVLVAVSVANYRTRRLAGTSAIGCLAFATATFTCPACSVPMAAILGVALIGSTIPLFGLGFQLIALVIQAGSLVWFSRRL